ncbi:MAG: hypothetical protein BGO87_12705 [Flavobacteriia bacterium 40-80]|nr:MAG: hypothetical protein BGO87_12705 [Flavobacteriia bacterium 40-80]
MAGLNKEIWLPDLMEGFYADDMFLSECRDMTAFVDNDTINLAEAGVNPDVLINNTSYPIATAQRADTALALPLDTYDTENTLIRAIETAELSYDKRSSVLFGHRMALRMRFMEYAAFRIAPATNGTYTPIITATGANNGSGNKRLTFADVLNLQRQFDEAEMPSEGRILVLSAQHRMDLQNEDRDLYNQLLKDKSLYGFKLYSLASKRLPRYNKTTGAKVAWQATDAPSTDVRASIAFHKDEVMRAQGTVDMFAREKDPDERGDKFGFQMRGLSMPIRNKGIAAIYSPAA